VWWCGGVCATTSKYFLRFGAPDVGNDTVVAMAATLFTDETYVIAGAAAQLR
jgi:hypothetical protein